MPKKIMRLTLPAQVNFDEVARLSKGSEKGFNESTGKPTIGKDYNSHYLRIRPDDRFRSQKSENGFLSLYDELLDRWEKLISRGSVKVRLPFPDLKDCYFEDNTSFMKWGTGTRRASSCDGTTCTLSNTFEFVEKVVKGQKKKVKKYKFDRTPKPCMAGEDGICPMGCTPKAWLRLIIPEWYPGGVVVFPLGSPIDISNIRRTLAMFEKHGLDRIPFNLFRKPSVVNYEDDRGDQSRENWSVRLVLDGEVAARLTAKADRQFDRFLESDSDIIDADSIEVPQQRSIAPSPTAPNFKQSDDGYNFLNQLRAAMNEGSLELLSDAVEIAKELVESGYYDRSGLAWIDSEETRARSSIRELSSVMPAPIVAKKAQTPAQRSIAFFQIKTQLPWDEIKIMASRLELPASEEMTQDNSIVLVKEILLHWACDKYFSDRLFREQALILVDKSIESTTGDEALWADFEMQVEAYISDNQ